MSPRVSPPNIAPGDTVGGRYRIVRVVGEGGMGTVFEAETADGEHVAVKTLVHDGFAIDDAQRARFEREAAICSDLRHPRLVHVVEYGVTARGAPYLVMPLFRGEDLARTIEREGALDPASAVRVVLQACDGIAAAHAAGVVHRDLKPSNLFLHREGDHLDVKVGDFGVAKMLVGPDGLARSLTPGLTHSGDLLGTPLYMAPEQILDPRTADAQCDVWGIGMTLYHALAGAPAFGTDKGMSEALQAIARGVVPPLQERAPWIDPEIAEVVHGALVARRDERCPSIDAFATALAAAARVDRADLRLSASDVHRVGEHVRSVRATRAALPARWDEVASTQRGAVGDGEGRSVVHPSGRVYRFVRRIGGGGMGDVFEARTETGEARAVKLIRRDLVARGSAATRRFLREAEAAMAIESPHVTRTIEAATDKATGLPFLVMEMLHGVDMASVLGARGPLDPKVAARLIRDASRGVAAAHGLGIVHRDIKPANVFLSDTGAGAVVKVCDFGVAKDTRRVELHASDAGLTDTGAVLGSPLYMSPEQAKNAKNVDARSDVWSLGITLYEALSGTHPWRECTTLGELILSVCTKDVPPLAGVAPWVDPGLARVVDGALRREVDERYATADALARALDPFVDEAPIRIAEIAPVPRSVRVRAVAAASAASDSASGHVRPVTAGRVTGRRSLWAIASAVVLVGVPIGFASLRGASRDAASSSSQVASSAAEVVVSPATPASVAVPAVSAHVATEVRDAGTSPFGRLEGGDASAHDPQATPRRSPAPRRVVAASVDASASPRPSSEPPQPELELHRTW